MKDDVKWSLTFRYIAGVLLLAAVIAFLVYARDVVRTLAIAAFAAYLINPAVDYLSARTRVTRTAAVNYVYFSALILLIAIPAILAPIFYDDVQIILGDLAGISNQLRQLLSSPIRIAGFVFHLEEWGASLFQFENDFLTPLPEEALEIIETTSVGFLWFLVVLVSIHFFLAQWPRMRENLIAFAPQPYRPELHELYTRVRRVWMAYLRGQIVLMIIVGVVFTIAWMVMGIPGALFLGVIAGLFTLVPDIGPFLAAVLAVGVALLEGSTWIPLPNFMVAGIAALVYLVLIGLKNFFLRPYIMGRSVHMNEALVFIIIVVATVLEGILGALLVVPLYATTVVILGYLQRKIQGLPPFEDDGSRQFIMPQEQINPPGRKWGRRATDRLEGAPSPISDPAQATVESAALLGNASPPKWGHRATDHIQEGPVADPPAISPQPSAPALKDDSSDRETQ